MRDYKADDWPCRHDCPELCAHSQSPPICLIHAAWPWPDGKLTIHVHQSLLQKISEPPVNQSEECEMANQSFPNIDELLNKSSDAIDKSFEEGCDSFEQCRKRSDKLRFGAEVCTSTPVTENNAMILVTQGEGSHEVRVPRGCAHLVFPCTPICVCLCICGCMYVFPSHTTRWWVA